jgi:alpha-galactosidase
VSSAISAGQHSSVITAVHLAHEIVINPAAPAREWENASSISFSSDWRGEHPNPDLQTKVCALWSQRDLYLRFECRYRDLFVFNDAGSDRRRDKLWERDVVEAFLQPDPSRERYYREFEVSPNGMWIDLEIFPGGIANLRSGMKSSVALNDKAHTWSAELAIPIKAITADFDPESEWRVNFYRVEGRQEPRSYLAWQPTGTPEPNFHVPSAFGRMKFQL